MVQRWMSGILAGGVHRAGVLRADRAQQEAVGGERDGFHRADSATRAGDGARQVARSEPVITLRAILRGRHGTIRGARTLCHSKRLCNRLCNR
ncbi:hypothetical protein GCM10019016_007230 [Streptomyces prasinosporus]|uniref:Uncharacterized protein n=1 Tax=Streptomyces prasinosporus TaxID=68256 RepID=A0ABP6TG99_9ACTN